MGRFSVFDQYFDAIYGAEKSLYSIIELLVTSGCELISRHAPNLESSGSVPARDGQCGPSPGPGIEICF